MARELTPSVASDRRQVEALADRRFPSFAYERLLTFIIRFVDDGCRGMAINRVVSQVKERWILGVVGAALLLGGRRVIPPVLRKSVFTWMHHISR